MIAHPPGHHNLLLGCKVVRGGMFSYSAGSAGLALRLLTPRFDSKITLNGPLDEEDE
jgi:hypothetical protein